MTIEQLKLGNVINPQKHNVNEKALKESVESKDYQAVDFDYDNDIINKKSFEVIFPPQIAFIYKIFQILPNKVYNFLINKFVNR